MASGLMIDSESRLSARFGGIRLSPRERSPGSGHGRSVGAVGALNSVAPVANV